MKKATQDHAQPVEQTGLSRRSLLRLAAVGTLGIAAGIGTTSSLAHWIRTEPAPYQFFSEAEARLLIAICEQIIPRDDAPGATDAGVIFYIDRQLASVFFRHQQTYRVGLESFRQTCLQVYKLPFEQLSFDQQTDTLRLMESGKASQKLWGDRSPSAFFELVLEHTRQGFYGSPRHGGNRDYVSYRMLGVAYPNLIGQNRYTAGRPI